ncbi:MAG: DUF3726 domain-containing protein [Dongiaceae bacterium]
MIPSLNEVETIASRATRGAGRPWGLAEEAARAARWLARHGLPWERLADLLADDGIVAPVLEPGRLRPAGDGRLCPLRSGALVAEGGTGLLPLRLERVAVPLLLLPFAADLAHRAGRRIALAWPAAQFTCEPGGAVARAAGPVGQHDGSVDGVEIREAARSEAVLLPPTAPRRAPDPAALATLQQLARRTYVPATERSRREGAGAGLLDSD